VVVPHLRFADVYVFVALGLEVEAMEDLGDFVESLELEGELLDEATFLYQNCCTPEALLARGLAFGVFRKGRLASPATLLALTPGYCDVGVYILPRYRHRGYAMDCVEALFAEAFDCGVRPLWRIGIRPKLGMEEIGTTGRKVYLQPVPVR
jgi:GNAT superfamily N-acetyltransferase